MRKQAWRGSRIGHWFRSSFCNLSQIEGVGGMVSWTERAWPEGNLVLNTLMSLRAGTWTRSTNLIGPRTPLGQDPVSLDYTLDSDAEWEEADQVDGDDVMSADGREEDGMTQSEDDSDLDDWLEDDLEMEEVEEDDEVVEVDAAGAVLQWSGVFKQPAAPSLAPIPNMLKPKKKVPKPFGRRFESKLVPFQTGPHWETAVGESAFDNFDPYRIELLNGMYNGAIWKQCSTRAELHVDITLFRRLLWLESFHVCFYRGGRRRRSKSRDTFKGRCHPAGGAKHAEAAAREREFSAQGASHTHILIIWHARWLSCTEATVPGCSLAYAAARGRGQHPSEAAAGRGTPGKVCERQRGKQRCDRSSTNAMLYAREQEARRALDRQGGVEGERVAPDGP